MKFAYLPAAIVLSAIAFWSCSKDNHPTAPVTHMPQVDSVVADVTVIQIGDSVRLMCQAHDEDGDSLSYYWYCELGGTFLGGRRASNTIWLTPVTPVDSVVYTIFVRVTDHADTNIGAARITVFNGDAWNDTGEPYIDLPDSNGDYNRLCDPGEFWYDLPSAYNGPFQRASVPATNGIYNGHNAAFDDYELFTYPAPPNSDPRYPVLYTFGDVRAGMRDSIGRYTGEDWLDRSLYPDLPDGTPGYLRWIEGKSTWRDRNGNGIFDIPLSHLLH